MVVATAGGDESQPVCKLQKSLDRLVVVVAVVAFQSLQTGGYHLYDDRLIGTDNIRGMRQHRDAIGAPNQPHGVIRRQFVPRNIARPARRDPLSEGIIDIGGISRFDQRLRHVRPPHRPFSELVHPLPGDVDSDATQLLHHALAPDRSGFT